MKYKISPLTLIIINILVPVFLLIGKGTVFEFYCMGIGLIILLLYQDYKECIYFLLVYSLVQVILILMNWLSMNNLLLFLGTFFYILNRLIPVMMIALVLVKNVQSNELLSALEEIRLPKKIVLSVAVALRFFPTYRAEIRMIGESLKMRNIRLSLFQPIKGLEFWVVPLLIRASMIAEEMTATAITKGVEVPTRRTSFYQVKISALDIIFLVGILFSFGFFWLGGKWIA